MKNKNVFEVLGIPSLEDIRDIYDDDVILRSDLITIKDEDYPKSFKFNINTGHSKQKIKIISRAGIFFEGRAEFYIHWESGNLKFDDFSIGNVVVKAGTSSRLLYLLNGLHNEDLGMGYELVDAEVIILENVKEDNFMDILDEALFKIGLGADDFLTKWPTVGIDEKFQYLEDHSNELTQLILKRKVTHPVPIALFNTGKRSINNQDAFLQFYKILEFYYEKAQDEHHLKFRNKNISNINDLKTIKKFRTSERDSLSALVKKLCTKKNVDFIKDVFDEFLNSKNLATKIYDYRCSIVHAKEKKASEISLNDRFIGENSDKRIVQTVEILALLSIRKWSLS